MPSALFSLVGPAHQLLLLLVAFKCDVFWANKIWFDRQRKQQTGDVCGLVYGYSSWWYDAQSLFQASLFGGKGEEGTPPQKKSNSSPKRLPNWVLYFFRPGQWISLPVYHGNFLLTHNKHKKLFVIKHHKKRANLHLKFTKIRFAAGLRPHPLGELTRFPRPPSRDF